MGRCKLLDGVRPLSWAAIILPSVHLALLGSLLFHCKLRPTYVSIALLMTIYFAMQLNAANSGLDISCGCFSHGSAAAISVYTMLVPVAMATSALICLMIDYLVERKAADLAAVNVSGYCD